jgi:hypothetical protein
VMGAFPARQTVPQAVIRALVEKREAMAQAAGAAWEYVK